MGRFFPVTPRAGKPLSMRGLARGLARLEFAFSNMRVYNGRVDWSEGLDVPTLSFGDDGAGSSPEFIRNAKEIVGDGLPDAPPDPDTPPCGHPGNDGGGSPDDHPGDDPDGGDQDSGDSDHPGDSPSPPSSGDCE